MELLFLIELTAGPDRREFVHKRSYPANLDVDFVIAALVAGFPKSLPAEAILFEAWGTAKKFSDTLEIRRQLRDVAKETLVPAQTMPKTGPPDGMASIALEPNKPRKRWRVVLYGGSTRDCDARKQYCLWVLSQPDRQNAKRLAAAILKLDESLAELQAPNDFRNSLDQMDELLAGVEQYSQERLAWLSRGYELVALDQSAAREFRSHISDLLDTSSGLSRPQELRGAERERRLQADWRSFFRDLGKLKASIPPERLKGLVEEYLGRQAGVRFSTLAERKAFARTANEAVRSLDFRFACTGELEDGSVCNLPSALRCDEFNGRDGGIFYFTHTLRTKAFRHGFSSVVPAVNLVSPAPRAARTTTKSPAK